ncbi:putative tetraacyldisaccharide 4'-kinase, mitochondrial isoform X2 [Apium graveolens]|uniref:putative tetraacyldisaccharide 4'-kinase, mitochondrial isoform X2 n=1 Tax=Apium graveolens TaxID=4045 RepID=UPI003D7AEE9E
MGRVRKMVNEIAYTPLIWSSRVEGGGGLSELSTIQLSLIPLLSLTSFLYKIILSLRHHLYRFRLLPTHSVGNLSWGGNGKTPMVEFIAHCFLHSGISPLILTRGYGCADEAKMLQRHFHATSARIGVGANRAAIATSFLQNYSYTHHRLSSQHIVPSVPNSSTIGVVILDDGMQHLHLGRDVDIVMVNGMMPWGNRKLLPLGPLREPLTALTRANIVVVHHADLMLEQEIEVLELTIRENNKAAPIYYAKMTPSHLFSVGKVSCELPLAAIHNRTIFCLSAIGCADSFARSIEQLRPRCVDRMDFNDHHVFRSEDVEKIMLRLQELLVKFGSEPIVIVTEKDYDRDPKMFRNLEPFEVLVLCSKLQIVSRAGCTDEQFKKCIKQLLKAF